MRNSPRLTLAAIASLALVSTGVSAGIYGSLGNFDVVNDTGSPAYGFQIDLEDPLYRSPLDPAYDPNYRLTSVFGLDRDFGIPGGPAAVVRYGSPSVTYDLPGGGVRIRYGGTVGNISTPSGSFQFPGDSCWPGSGLWSTAAACDHFGVATTSSPRSVKYYWLMDAGSGGATVPLAATLPPVIILPTPNPAPNAPPLQMVVPAPDLGAAPVDSAYWVKIVKTDLGDNVALIDLLGGNHDGARPEIRDLDNPEIEVEWQPLQIGNKLVDEVTKVLDSPRPSVVYKFEFFRYQGEFDHDGLVDPHSGQFPQIDAQGRVFVELGDGNDPHFLTYVGQQIAGFNVNEVAAVPEPQTWALMLAGLALVGGVARRRR